MRCCEKCNCLIKCGCSCHANKDAENANGDDLEFDISLKMECLCEEALATPRCADALEGTKA